ncbi:MAG TPA: LLM class flavin-dependent oxidoreductase [Candidatus Limnocylindria bacterium]|nr:LLM class flavin-dependent oxidoreductase [Candidatus Limnocylindria bacterium]
MRPGIGLPSNVTLPEAERLAAEAEASGAPSVWITDLRRDPYLVSAAALRATSRVTVGTNVAVAFARSPAATAQAAWDLAGASGGRFILGLGSQVGPTLLARFGVTLERPAPRLRDYVRAVRACFDAYRAGRGRYEGEFYSIRQPVFAPGADDPWPDVPVYVAAVNPLMGRVAGEVADGLAAHMFSTPRYLDEVLRPALADGAARAGRPVPRVVLPLVVGRDRASVAMYMTVYHVPAYRRVLDASGLGEEMDAILAAIADRRRTEAARIVDARVLDHLAATTIEELPAALARWREHADEVGLSVPWYGTDHAAQVALFRELLRAIERL